MEEDSKLFVYKHKRTEPSLWTVGFYTPDGTWETESDHDNPEEAAERVHYLNGGNNSFKLNIINQTGYVVDICCGRDKEFKLANGEEVKVKVENDDCLYIDQVL